MLRSWGVYESVRLKRAPSAVDERPVDNGREEALADSSRLSVALNDLHVPTAKHME